MEKDNNWKLRLRYGQLQTPYQHMTLLAVGMAGALHEDYGCPQGEAIMGMKVWAMSDKEAADMIQVIGEQIGFKVTGNIKIYYTAPEEPPGDNPYGYDINFTPVRDE